jgi:branched-chain amino acid transport system ATP-binding protein
VLEVKNLNVFYGNIHALFDVSFKVEDGEIITLIGANGSGKTTTLHSISGIVPLKSGNVVYDDADITGIEPHKIVLGGLVQVPEGRRIFANLTVQENLEMGAYTRTDASEIKRDYDVVFTNFPRLKERRKQQGGTLSGGEQQMLAIGRALMSRPKLLLLDEPSMGLAPVLVDEIFEIIQQINKNGVTILLVEQNAYKALSIADRAYILETGRITMTGNAADLKNNESVKKAYLGG